MCGGACGGCRGVRGWCSGRVGRRRGWTGRRNRGDGGFDEGALSGVDSVEEAIAALEQSGFDGTSVVCVVDPDGGNLRPLLPEGMVADPDWMATASAWSPDGSAILVGIVGSCATIVLRPRLSRDAERPPEASAPGGRSVVQRFVS